MYDRIKEVIAKEILLAKKEALTHKYNAEYPEVNCSDDCNEWNCYENANDSATEYEKILNFVKDCEKDFDWLRGKGTNEIGVGKSNWGTLRSPNKKENPLNKNQVDINKLDTRRPMFSIRQMNDLKK